MFRRGAIRIGHAIGFREVQNQQREHSEVGEAFPDFRETANGEPFGLAPECLTQWMARPTERCLEAPTLSLLEEVLFGSALDPAH